MPAENAIAVQEHRKAIDRMTEIADTLMAQGYTDIYEELREDLQHDLESKGVVVGSASAKSSAASTPAFSTTAVHWQYKWVEDGPLFGPFTAQHMAEWQQQGYFVNPMWARKVRVNEQGTVLSSEPFQVSPSIFQ